MTEEEISIAKRLVKSPNWEWMPGMLTLDSQFLSLVSDDIIHELYLRLPDYKNEHYPDEYDWPHDLGLRVPIITDPPTLGCLLALVRKAWGMPTGITVSYSDDEALWRVSWSGSTHGGFCGKGKTEGEALANALLNKL